LDGHGQASGIGTARVWRSLAFAVLCGAGSFAAPAFGQANAVASGPYVSLGGGVGFNDSLDAHQSGFAGAAHDTWKLDAGGAGEVSLGWAFDDGLRLEGEADLLTNKVRGVTGEPAPVRAGGLDSKFGGFVNLMYDFRLGLPIVPYLGVGIGGQAIEHDSFNVSTPGFMFPEPVRGHQVVGDFAYQGIAGIAYPVGFLPGLSLTAEYRFLGLLDPQPSFRFAGFDGGESPSDIGSVRFSSDYTQSVMLGLRYVLFAPRGAAMPPGAPSAGEPPVEAPSRTYLVFFDWDRADLTARARQIVAEAASASAHVRTTRIEVNGYTDLSGSSDYNKRLSVRRGESVAAELVRDGVAREEITVTGYGEAAPLVATAKGVREPQNRRVEIILH
jgi:OOP family OmpA-OmpF porin